jgi:hypothetical protein
MFVASTYPPILGAMKIADLVYIKSMEASCDLPDGRASRGGTSRISFQGFTKRATDFELCEIHLTEFMTCFTHMSRDLHFMWSVEADVGHLLEP